MNKSEHKLFLGPYGHRYNLTDVKIGDSIFDDRLTGNNGNPTGWEYVGDIPEIAAGTWITQEFVTSFINKDLLTSENTPIKNWEEGLGIVVSTPRADYLTERLLLLHLTKSADFKLYRTENTRLIVASH